MCPRPPQTFVLDPTPRGVARVPRTTAAPLPPTGSGRRRCFRWCSLAAAAAASAAASTMGLRGVIYALGGAARRAGVAMDAAGSRLQGPTAYSECRMFVRTGGERRWLAEGRTCFLFSFRRASRFLLSFVSYCSPPWGCGGVRAGSCGSVHWTILDDIGDVGGGGATLARRRSARVFALPHCTRRRRVSEQGVPV